MLFKSALLGLSVVLASVSNTVSVPFYTYHSEVFSTSVASGAVAPLRLGTVAFRPLLDNTVTPTLQYVVTLRVDNLLPNVTYGLAISPTAVNPSSPGSVAPYFCSNSFFTANAGGSIFANATLLGTNLFSFSLDTFSSAANLWVGRSVLLFPTDKSTCRAATTVVTTTTTSALPAASCTPGYVGTGCPTSTTLAATTTTTMATTVPASCTPGYVGTGCPTSTTLAPTTTTLAASCTPGYVGTGCPTSTTTLSPTPVPSPASLFLSCLCPAFITNAAAAGTIGIASGSVNTDLYTLSNVAGSTGNCYMNPSTLTTLSANTLAGVVGTVVMTESTNSIFFTVRLTGCQAGSLYQMNANTFGNIFTLDGSNTGGVFNIAGNPTTPGCSPGTPRRTGDLGFFIADVNGQISATFFSSSLTLNPAALNNVLGRSLVVTFIQASGSGLTGLFLSGPSVCAANSTTINSYSAPPSVVGQCVIGSTLPIPASSTSTQGVNVAGGAPGYYVQFTGNVVDLFSNPIAIYGNLFNSFLFQGCSGCAFNGNSNNGGGGPFVNGSNFTTTTTSMTTSTSTPSPTASPTSSAVSSVLLSFPLAVLASLMVVFSL